MKRREKLRHTVSSRWTLLRLLPSAGWRIVVALAALTIASPLLSYELLVSGGRLVGSIPAAAGHGFGSPAGRHALHELELLATVFVLQYLATNVRQTLISIAGRRVDRGLRSRVLDATLSPPGVAHVEDPEVLDAIAKTRGEAFGMPTGVAAAQVVAICVNRLAVVPPTILMLEFQWWLPCALGVALLWTRVVMRQHVLNSVESRMEQSGVLRRSEYFVDLALQPAAAKETRVFGLGAWLGHRYSTHYLEAMKVVWNNRVASRRRFAAPLVVTFAVNTIAFALITQAALNGAISLARLTILLSAANGMRALLSLGNEDVHVEQASVVVPSILRVERMMRERREAISGARQATGLPHDAVRFEGVRFRYPGNDREIYRDLNLEIRAGQSLAIVGANGAGKTTLVKLLARLHDPTGGRITVDGIDLLELDPSSWQRRVAAIFQDFTKYELSARDNVGFGSLDLVGDDDALRAAAAAAGAGALIDELPHGWNTTLSRRFTDGTDLSGGQWQRVALARALLAVRGGAGILVLDEPTANLDVRAEAELYDRFLELTRGVTTVVISHRFSTVRRADRIVVLNDGEVVEDGTHDELVNVGGIYARMFAVQAARFAEDAVHG